MNDFYLRKNGKAIVFDEEGVETSREYEDGMRTILESENRVEKIEKNIVVNKKQNRKNKFLRLVTMCTTGVFSAVAFYFIYKFINVPDTTIYNLPLVASSLLIPVSAGLMEIFNKRVKGGNYSDTILKEELERENVRLQELKENKSKEIVEEKDYGKVPRTGIKSVDKKSGVSYQFGQRKDYYYKRYKNNTLTNYLKKKGYDEEQINMLYEMIARDLQLEVDDINEKTQAKSEELARKLEM